MLIKPQKGFYNVDPVSGEFLSSAIFDGYLDEFNALCSRFGLVEFTDLATGFPGDGLFWWDKSDFPIAVSGGQCFKFDSAGSLTELTGGNFNTGTQATFADGQKVDNSAFLYACNGAKLNYSTGGNFTQAGVPAPQTCSHVVYNGLRFLANEVGTARFYFTDVNPADNEFDPTYWAAIENPLTSDSRGDNILGMYPTWDDVAIWGTQSREIWQVTGSSPPLQPRLGSLCEAGLVAPYSVQNADNTIFALCIVDKKLAVVRLLGNDPVIISLDIEKILDGFHTFNDAIGDVVSVGGQSFYIITFPTEDQTWAYNIKKKEWYQWSWWKTIPAKRGAFIGRNFIYAKSWGKHFCQSRLDGKIYEVIPEAKTDDGNTIKTEWQTGWLDGGTSKNKTMPFMRFHMRRGEGILGTDEPVIAFKYRDNGSRVWKNERQVGLGNTGEYEFYRRVNGLGMFRTRQMSIILTDAAKLVLADLDVEIKRLGN